MTESRVEAESRVKYDSLGEVRLPAQAYYGAQTQRAVENFPVSGRAAAQGADPRPGAGQVGGGAWPIATWAG